jgi:hypothetical protein
MVPSNNLFVSKFKPLTLSSYTLYCSNSLHTAQRRRRVVARLIQTLAGMMFKQIDASPKRRDTRALAAGNGFGSPHLPHRCILDPSTHCGFMDVWSSNLLGHIFAFYPASTSSHISNKEILCHRDTNGTARVPQYRTGCYLEVPVKISATCS